MKRPNVAIDGLAASGKSTVARALARRLGLVFLDTGMMYRAVTWLSLRRPTVDPGRLAAEMDLQVFPDVSHASGCRVLVEGENVTEQLHTPAVSREVARIAAISEVRREMVRKQQLLGQGGGLIMVGRDIATVVLPDAEVKIFLTAEPHERARRRFEELRAKNPDVTQADIERDLAERDRIDTSREDSPLECVPDAHLVDTTGMTEEEVIDRLAGLVPAGTP
jgi:cytidylate kinase